MSKDFSKRQNVKIPPAGFNKFTHFIRTLNTNFQLEEVYN